MSGYKNSSETVFSPAPFQGVAPEWFGQVSGDGQRSGERGIR